MYSHSGESDDTQQLAATNNQPGERGAYSFISFRSVLLLLYEVHACELKAGQHEISR